MKDEQIISLYLDRDEKAIEETQTKYGNKLTGLSYKILHNAEDSEECVSDTYLKTWNTIPPQKPDFFFAYLAKICRFLCFGKLDYNKAKKRNAQVVSLSEELLSCIPSQLVDNTILQMELKDMLEDFLKKLSADKRIIFMRRYWFCDTISEIAIRFHISESKVKTSLFRTREKLKIYLQKEGMNI